MELRRIGVVRHTKRGAVIKIDVPYPERPNPIALTASEILDVEFGRGEILVAFIDAEDWIQVFNF